MKPNTYRNWHKPSAWYKTVDKELSDVWWPTATIKKSGTTEISFYSTDGKCIQFNITDEQRKTLLRQLTIE